MTHDEARTFNEIELNERCGPLFDLFLRFEKAFARLAIERLDITDEDAEAFAVIMAETDAGAAFAYLMRHIKTERVMRRVCHMAAAVFESRRSAGIDRDMIQMSELGGDFDKLHGGST